MRKHPERYELRLWMNAFLALVTVADFSRLMGMEAIDLYAIAGDADYSEFQVPKKCGGFRLIENPDPRLKSIQRRLNDFLQGVYHFHSSESAYGFLVCCGDEQPHLRRNIVNNARQHLGMPWMLNMDIKDFFHAVTAEKVAWIFLSKPFEFDKDLASLLMRLTTWKGRLPMGAPSSPILSNFAAKLLDGDLEELARSRQWVYTRYADDMSFSSRKEITLEDIELLMGYYEAHGFTANAKKIKIMGPKDEHSVTGIVIGEDKLDLKDEFFEELDVELRQLKEVSAVKGRLGVTLTDWADEYRDRVEGMITFAAFVLGERHDKVVLAKRKLEKAMQAPKDFGSYSWLDFPYV